MSVFASAPQRELLLLRHAKSDWKNQTLADFDRPLADKGKKAATRLADWIDQHQLWPEAVWVSPAKRTRQTLKRLKLPPSIPVTAVNSLYQADLATLFQLLKQYPPECQRLLWIGHNPGFESLLSQLTGQHHAFPTATLAHLRLPALSTQPLESQAQLLHYIRPKTLKHTATKP